MMKMSSMFFFKRIIVGFWAIWWISAFLTDFLGGLYLLNIVTETWVPHSNYPGLVTSLAQYGAPSWLPSILFGGIIAWSLLSALAFVFAALTPAKPSQRWRARVNSAFIISLGLWFAFFIADQTVMMFDLEENHMVQGGFQLLTFMAIHLLPDD
jgi:hypothetical protein